MNKAFLNFTWENFPSINSPLNDYHLNLINRGLNEVDDRVIRLDKTKVDLTEVSTLFKDVSFTEETGVLTFTRYNGGTVTVDTKLEKLAINFRYDPAAEQLIIQLDDGTEERVDLSALVTQYEFLDSGTIAFHVQADGKVSAEVKEGSIEERHLRPNYLADIKIEAARAETAGNLAEESATRAESWAIGGTGSREGENTDNAKYYAELAEQGAAESGWLTFEIDKFGHLWMYRRGLDDINFALVNGRMEVTLG